MTELATAFRDAGLLKFDPKKAATKDAKADERPGAVIARRLIREFLKTNGFLK
ncbi:MAG: hypothetical protein WBD78_07350 [Methylocella sp.]